MFEIIIMLLLILSNIYIDSFNYIYNFFIEHYQLLINLFIILFYAFLNDDFDFNIENDDDNHLEENLNEYINKEKQDKKK